MGANDFLGRRDGSVDPKIRYIGWDLAYTEDGWVVIEGNGGGQFIIPQIVWSRGFKNDLKEILKDVKFIAN